MQTERHDPYLASLEIQERDLDAEERALDELQADLNAGRENVAKGRASVKAAREHYLAFLASKLKTAALPAAPESGRPVAHDEIPLPARIGPKHRSILEALRVSVGGLTSREIADRTGVNVDVVRNVVLEALSRNIIIRDAGRVYLSPDGLDYMERLRAKFGPHAPPKETPPTTASGVFQ